MIIKFIYLVFSGVALSFAGCGESIKRIVAGAVGGCVEGAIKGAVDGKKKDDAKPTPAGDRKK